jgi:hypothetical protein
VSYPDDSSHPIIEWLIDGSWVDVSDRVRGQVDITRGRQNEQSSVSPSQAYYSMNNHDAVFSNRNPSSPYYRKIPSGTQQRIRAGEGDNSAYIRPNSLDEQNSVRTTDKAALDITGDIEIRVDVEPHTWRPANRVMIFASKYLQTGDQRSWVLYMNYSGRLQFAWSTDGTIASRITVQATTPVPANNRRLSIKVTLDANNGAGGNTVTFYTASSIDGTYTMLGSPVITSGVTSIKAGTAALVVGAGDDQARVFTNGMTFGGHFHGMHVYNGIAGSRVADPIFSTWDLDSTSLADSHGNTWELNGQARITSPRVRFWGELTSATQTEDKSGNDKLTPIMAADMLQRLGNARITAESPLYLNISRRAGLLGYWPLEDGTEAEFAANAVSGGKRGLPRNINFGQSTGLPGSKQEAEFESQLSNLKLQTKKGTNTGTWHAVWFFKMPTGSLPLVESTVLSISTTGFTRAMHFLISDTTFGLRFNSSDLTTAHSTSASYGTGVTVKGEWIGMRVQVIQDGANIDYEWAWYAQETGNFVGTSGTFAGTGIGYPTSVSISTQANSLFSGSKFAHVVVAEQALGFASGDSTWSSAIQAYAGENAAERIIRTAESAELYCEILGETESTAVLGPQPVDTPLNVMLDAARADGGFLAGLRDAYGIFYRSRQDLERHGDAELDYTDHLSEVPEVVDDDQVVTNAFTASRPGGSSAYAEITEGYTSTAEPPLGVGWRPGGADFNLFNDDTLQDLANLRARYGSYDAPRIPNLAVALHRALTHPSTATGLAVMRLDLGSTAEVSGWPPTDAPDGLTFLVQGYRERLSRFLWEAIFNVSPAGPFRTGTYNTDDQFSGAQRYGSSSSTLSAGITSSATTIILAGTARIITVETWTTAAGRYPLDIMIGGERIRLNTPPTGSTSPQTFNGVTRSINGISKAHDAGEDAQIYRPTHYGLGA